MAISHRSFVPKCGFHRILLIFLRAMEATHTGRLHTFRHYDLYEVLFNHFVWAIIFIDSLFFTLIFAFRQASNSFYLIHKLLL